MNTQRVALSFQGQLISPSPLVLVAMLTGGSLASAGELAHTFKKTQITDKAPALWSAEFKMTQVGGGFTLLFTVLAVTMRVHLGVKVTREL